MMKAFYNIELKSSFEPTEDGGLIVHNVPIMCEGAWTAMQGIHTIFSAEVLAKYADNWSSLGVWTRHPGGSPRDADEKVGAVRNPHYDSQVRGVVGDLYLHQKSDRSRSSGQIVQLSEAEGGIKSVSAETILEMDSHGNVTHITFTGVALVDDGACEVCKIPAFEAGGEKMTEEEKTETVEEVTETEEVKVDAEETPVEPNAELLNELLELFEDIVPGLSERVGNVTSSEDDIARASAKGALKEFLSACSGKKTYSIDEDLRTAFEKQNSELALLKAQVEAFSKGAQKTETTPLRTEEMAKDDGAVKLGVSMGNMSRAAFGGRI